MGRKIGSGEESVDMYGPFGDRWLLRLECALMGWTYDGYYTDTEYSANVDYNTGKVSVNKKHFRRLLFSRPWPYTKNFLFKLFELLAKLVSWIRRCLRSILIILLIVGIVVGVMSGGESLTFMWIMVGVIAGTWCASLFFPFLCFLMRKAFKIDEKLKAAIDGTDENA